MQNNADQVFYQKVEEWLGRILEENPVAATALGDHRFDHRLSDYSRSGLLRKEQLLNAALTELERLDPSQLSLDARLDYEIILRLGKSFLRELQYFRGFQRNPNAYLDECIGGVFLLLIRDFAPFPERLRLMVARAREIPRVLQEAEGNLVPEEVPLVWVEIALESLRRAVPAISFFLPALALRAPRALPGMVRASRAAARALTQYHAFLEEKVKPKARGEFAIGENLFQEILREDHFLDIQAGELLRLGQDLLRQTREEMEALAKRIDPRRSAQEILEEAKNRHPAPKELLPAYRQEVQRAREFVARERVVTIPEGESLRVEPTPPHLRLTIPFAAYTMPGPLEKKQEGIFWVTPPDWRSPAKVRAEKLRGHFWAKIPVTVVHEAYPGHHLQLVFANRYAQTLPRKLGSALSSLFVEGWAFYCEELMENLGYLSDPVQKLVRLSDQLWRAARIVLDVSLHAGGMKVEEAVDFLVREVGMERVNALAEVRRYTLNPTQPLSYLVGKLEILKVIEDVKHVRPDLSLQALHDALLAQGSLPPKLLRKRLLAALGSKEE